jgi:hypothetical protein
MDWRLVTSTCYACWRSAAGRTWRASKCSRLANLLATLARASLLPMQLPSLYDLTAEARRVAWRFPLPLVCASILCVTICKSVYYALEAQQPGWLFPLGSASALSLPLTLALALAAERYYWPRQQRWAALGGAGTTGGLVCAGPGPAGPCLEYPAGSAVTGTAPGGSRCALPG